MASFLQPTLLTGLILVLGSLLSSGAICLWARRRWDHAHLKENNEAAGFVYAVVGVIYAVLLGFMVLAAYEEHQSAEQVVELEAHQLAALLRDAGALPDPIQSDLRRVLLGYLNDVAEHEWISMTAGKESLRAHAAFQQIWQTVYKFEPATPKETAVFQELIRTMNRFGDSRRDRLFLAKDSLPAPMWVLLIGGGFITVGYVYLFGMKNKAAHLAVVTSLTALVAFCLFMIYCLDHPFTGLLKLDIEAFLAIIEHQKLSEIPPGADLNSPSNLSD